MSYSIIECIRSTGVAKRRTGYTLAELLIVIAGIGILSAIAIPSYTAFRDRARISTTILEMKVIEESLKGYYALAYSYPATLGQIGISVGQDPWGNTYRYLNILNITPPDMGKIRKDRFMVPLNTDFDLYSVGPDGQSTPPLTAQRSRDDIVRANDGRFYGKASDY